MKNREHGFILLITLVWLMTLSALVLGILSTSKNSLRNERRWVGMDECYMYGQMALNSVRGKILDDAQEYFDDNVGEHGAFKDWFEKRLPNLTTELRNATTLPEKDPLGKEWPAVWQDGTYKVTDIQKLLKPLEIHILVKIIATIDGGQRAFEQHFVIKMGAAIFSYAYFINNNGWLHTTRTNTFYVNGDIGANANFSLAGPTIVNGSVFAAKRKFDEIQDPNGNLVEGKITDIDGRPDLNGYESSDKKTYETWLANHPEAMARGVLDTSGMTPEDIEGSVLYNPELIEGGRMPATEGSAPLKMPFLGELSSYAEQAKEAAAEGWGRLEYIDENGNPQTLEGNDVVVPGDLIIDGDFQIMGKIVVNGDLIIRGKYDKIEDSNLNFKGELDQATKEKLAANNGKGAFFVNRNINIIGDLKSRTGGNGEEDPFLSLAARGNIIMGDTRDIDMGLISNRNTAANGQMVPYETDDPMYQNVEGENKFNGNYSLPENGALAGQSGAVSLGSDNVYQQYKKVEKDGALLQTKVQWKIKQERYIQKYVNGVKTGDPERRTRWINDGVATYKAVGDEEEVVEEEDKDDIRWEWLGEWVQIRRKKIETEIYEKVVTYEPIKDRVFVTIASQGVQPQHGNYTSSYKSLLWRKVEIWKNNKTEIHEVNVEINGEVYKVEGVDSNNRERYYTADGEKLRGYSLFLNKETDSLINKGSATVDRAYFQNQMPINDYWALKPKSPQRIDAVLYTNHLIAGAMKRNGTINGSLVARDEALKIEKGSDPSTFSFNWDIRLGDNEFASNSYLQDAMESLMPATLGGKASSADDGVVFTREVTIN